MNKFLIQSILVLFVAGAIFYVFKTDQSAQVREPITSPPTADKSATPSVLGSKPVPTENIPNIPLEKAAERITKKPFSIFVTPKNSPVQPERFSGYHIGTDFEILSGEENQDITVFAICGGKIIYRNTVRGYGGVIIQNCAINNETVTVLYGHLSLAKSPAQINAEVKKGDQIAVLGEGYSIETGGERKHLHLGIHKGIGIELRGYMQKQSELSGWLDFQQVFGLK